MAMAGFALFVLGLVFIIVAPINRKKNSRCTAKTQGVLSDTIARYNSNGKLPDRRVYSYTVDGIEYEIASTAYISQAKNIGDECTIWYNPAKPEDAQPFRYESDKIYKIIFILGILIVLLGIILTMAGLAR